MVVITDNGLIAYDEFFHEGVNIIRGENSSGKSTIANLMFYGLGGDFNNWTDAALRCKNVFLEILINDSLLTIRRELSKSSLQPMSIYWGTYEKASKSIAEGWKVYPYKVSTLKQSFSNVIFNLLDYPELKGDQDSNITMHQIMRLIYIDQKSSTDSFFRNEQFDSPLTRKTVFELLIGTYDDSLYTNRLLLRDYEKELELRKKELNGIKRIMKSTDFELDKEQIQTSINKLKNQLIIVQSSLNSRNQIKISGETINKDLKNKLVNIQERILKRREELRKVSEIIYSQSLDISDSKYFINTINDRLNALTESTSFKDVIGKIDLTHCPQCLSKLKENENTNSENCNLCGNPLFSDDGMSVRARIKQELSLQIKESRKIIKEKEEDLRNHRLRKPVLEEELKALQIELNNNINEVKSSRDTQFDNLLIQKGNLQGQIDSLINQMKFTEQYSLLKKEVSDLGIKVTSLKDTIKKGESKQRNNIRLAMKRIEEITLTLLKGDLERQSEFKNGKTVRIITAKNTYSLDSKNNFSESSNVYLKNSIRYALFFSSLDLKFSRYPKFILCDNMEDKGMEKIRSQNFQNEIVKMALGYKRPFQIIFTTSMIAEELDNTEYCVGRFYTEKNKSLLLR